ncbi:MAG: protein-export chaperone SecB [Faecalibacterium sp.]
MAQAQCALEFRGYEVTSLQFEKNKNFEMPETGEVELTPAIGRTVTENGDELVVILEIQINCDSAPFQLKMTFEGIFGVCDEKQMDAEWHGLNATAILYPYFRAAVSNVMNNMNLPALVLPAINIVEAFKAPAVKE